MQDLLAHSGDDVRQFVGANMGMRIKQNIFRRPKLSKKVENAIDITALITSRVQLPVTVRSGAAFPETVIAFGIDDPFLI